MRGPILFGGAVVLLFFVGFGAWAATAPLTSGAIAPGVVSPDAQRKPVQHFEGGIVKSVLVRENQRVEAGQLLLTLDPIRAEANFAGQQGQWLRLLVTRARLAAEAAGADEWAVPPAVEGIEDSDLLDFVAAERRSFDSRRATLAQQEQIMERRIEQLQSEISAVEAESVGLGTQLNLTAAELLDKQRLLEQQLISRSEVLVLQREVARLESARASNDARIARAMQSIEETRLNWLQTRESHAEEVARLATQVNDSIAQLGEGMTSSSDALDRTSIRSSVAGVVLNLTTQTPGSVVRPGETIMEIVPVDEEMVVFARLAPKDIDLVTVGLQAHVTLIPFASRNLRPLAGEVIAVAADSKVDEASRQAFYEVRVRVSPEELAQHPGMYLAPGMPADVTIVTGERTLLQYLVDPFIKSLGSAFIYD
jgi:HlyD family type I secretion membrane fusion protein